MINYSVIENQRKVIARIDGCERDVLNLIKKKTGIEFDCEDLLLKNTYKGVAKCHPEDEFDIEEGKRVAKVKLLEKYNKAYNKALETATDITFSLYTDVAGIEDKHYR